MPAERSTLGHAARVAAVATVLVMTVYVVALLVLNVVVAHRLTHDADLRLAARLSRLHSSDLSTPAGAPNSTLRTHSNDPDDAPTFLWVLDAAGNGRALQLNSPRLPRHVWSAAPVTLDVGTALFRFRSQRLGGQLVVAGQSLAEVTRFQNAVEEPEILLGLVLFVAVFGGSLVIGLRASAPVEDVRRRQAEFTADASHELRTPLSVIEAEVELALSRPREAAFYEGVLVRIGAEGRRLRRIVDDLLWLARSDATRGTTGERTPVDVATAAAACSERFRAVGERLGVELTFVREGDARSFVLARGDDIDRLTGVLVDNACKHAGPGGRVEVAVRSSGSRVSLEVDDNGPGIPEDQVPFIFDRFHRAADQASGTGLGLAIADAIVRSTRGAWSVGRSPLGGARLAVSWRTQRHPTTVPPSGAPLPAPRFAEAGGERPLIEEHRRVPRPARTRRADS